MSLQKILENWSDYDKKKLKGQDASKFSCTESWEVDYLIDKIVRTYPSKSRQTVREAIEVCCKTVEAPRPREKFVICVLRRLGLIQPI